MAVLVARSPRPDEAPDDVDRLRRLRESLQAGAVRGRGVGAGFTAACAALAVIGIALFALSCHLVASPDSEIARWLSQLVFGNG